QPDPEKVVGDPTLSIRGGALRVMDSSGYLGYVRLGPKSLETLGRTFGIDLDRPWKDLPERSRKLMLWGSGEKTVTLEWAWTSSDSRTVVRGKDTKPFEGLLPALARAAQTPGLRAAERFLSETICSECQGTRLGPAARNVLFRERPITTLAGATIEQALAFFRGLELEPREALIGRQIVHEIGERLGF